MIHVYFCHYCDVEFEVSSDNKTDWVKDSNILGYPICYDCWKEIER